MEIKHFFKGIGGSALVAAVLVFSSSANAALITQLIHFDDANNGWKWYSDADGNFLFDPINLQSASLCADSTAGGNGSCAIEGKQGVLPLMTRPENGPTVNGVPSQGSASKDPDVSGMDQLFTLDSFYFLLTGKGTGSENAIIVEGSNMESYTFMLGGNYDGPVATDPLVSFYEGANAGAAAGDLVKNTGYIATFGDLFKDVTWIQFSAATSAQVRLDCVVNTFDGTTTQPQSSFSGGCGSSAVAEPGTLALLGLGLFGLVGFSRRERRSELGQG